MKLRILKQKFQKLLHSQLFWLQACAVGIWLLVIQNYFGGENSAQKVYVVGGNIDADVSGYVDANVSNTVSVEVENTVRTWNW